MAICNSDLSKNSTPYHLPLPLSVRVTTNLFALQQFPTLVFCQSPRFTIYPTAATATSTDPCPITIISPFAAKATPACLRMDHSSSEPSTSDLSQQECSPIRTVAPTISSIWSCTSCVCYSRRRIVPFGALVHDSARNDLYVFSTRDLSATLLQTSREIPSPYVGHAGTLVSTVFLIWGGDTNTGGNKRAPG